MNGPASGESITTESSEPYPHHHSLFFGCDHVNDGNYWQDVNDRGQIVSEGPVIVESGGNQVVFTDVCQWRKPGEEPVMRDERTVTITASSDTVRLIDFEITLTPLVDITITKTNHSLFSARVVPELSVNSGGTLINAQGNMKEEGTYGVESPWCDYSGARDGVTEGIAIFQNPNNRWYPVQMVHPRLWIFLPNPHVLARQRPPRSPQRRETDPPLPCRRPQRERERSRYRKSIRRIQTTN